MKEETKTIIIGVVLTLLVLVLAILMLYKINLNKESDSKDTNRNNNTVNNVDTRVSNTNNENNQATNNENNNTSNNNENNNTEPTNNTKEDNDVTIYLFHASYCGACKNALKNLNEKKDTVYKGIKVVTYEIDTNAENNKLMGSVAKNLGVEARYIPFFVIGNFSTTGYNEETLIDEYKKALKNADYKDYVEKTVEENKDIKAEFKIIE